MQRAHEALQKQEAELARYAEQVAADQRQAAALQAKIKAMEEKVSKASFQICKTKQAANHMNKISQACMKHNNTCAWRSQSWGTSDLLKEDLTKQAALT